LADELGAVVAADQGGSSAALFDDPLERTDGGVGAYLAGDRRCESFAGVLVRDGEDLDRATVSGPVADEVDRPDVIWTLGDQVPRHPGAATPALRPSR
jgi:hypothetical protein